VGAEDSHLLRKTRRRGDFQIAKGIPRGIKYATRLGVPVSIGGVVAREGFLRPWSSCHRDIFVLTC
jgi:hypothetical protein